MPKTIASFCQETDQAVPTTPGQFIRTILESLALTYAKTLQQLESLVGHKINRLHIVGGGSRNDLLNQLSADATGRTVIAGPVEATAIGNILIQALALGNLKSAAQLRQRWKTLSPPARSPPVADYPMKSRSFQKLQKLNP